MINKTNILAIILFASIGLAFLLSSALLYFKPNNAKLVKRKLKAGAALVLITAFFNGCAPKGSDIPSCYAYQEVDTSEYSITDTVNDQTIRRDTIYQKFLKQAVKIKKKKVINDQGIALIEQDSIVISCYEVQIEDPNDARCYMPIEPEIEEDVLD